MKKQTLAQKLHAAYMRRWRELNPQHRAYMKRYLKKYRANNKERYRRLRRAWYEKNKEKVCASSRQWARDHKERLRAITKARALKNLAIVVAVKKKGCVDCGKRRPLRALHFDHVDPDSKKFNIGRSEAKRRSTRSLLAEIAKCQVRCATCHRRRHVSLHHRGSLEK